MVAKIRKRDGSVVLFDRDKITEAIWKAVKSVGGTNRNRVEQLSEIVARLINEKHGETGIPEVEEVQDLVEKTLIEEGHAKVAKAYILYRKSHEELREVKEMFDTVEAVEDYIGLNDWMIKENSNMGFSLQGLNNYITTKIISNYWMRRVYPEAIRNAHENASIHVHDLGILGAYCVGWDLKDLLMTGFRGVKGKVESSPPKHFYSTLGQIINFFYTLQGESAGAQAFSNFDTLIAPFIRRDGLSYKEVKQGMQEFLFNMAVPTRVGFQCMSEDTEILTPNGWAKHNELKKGDKIKTFNIKKEVIEEKPIKRLFARKYKGVMYNLKNRIQDQLISPKHRIVRKKFQTENYILEEIEKVKNMNSPFIIPIAGKNKMKDAKISDEQIKLMAWVLGEGSIERPGKHRCCYRVSIYQSKIRKTKNYDEIKKLLNHFKFKFSEYTQKGLGEPVQRFRLNAESSKKIHEWFSRESINFVPNKLLNMGERQSRLFLETYIKAEGFEKCKISTTDENILNALQTIAVNAGYGSTVLTRNPTIGTKPIFVLRLIKHRNTYIQKIKKINYKGIIWCPNTDNETVIARRNGKVFITGNTPFTNITMDLKVPSYMRDEPVIIGGVPQKETYKEFQPEMDILNKAFAEVMLEGDAEGSVFTFPIPTYNITKDFDWDNPSYDMIWEMTAKYGIPYFSNFINSDMKPEDARSMCPLAGDEKVLIKSSRGRILEYGEIRNIFKSNSRNEEYEIYSEGRFVKGKFNSFKNQNMIKVILDNSHEIKMSEEHLNFVLHNKKSKEKEIKGKDLKKGMYLPYSLNVYKGEGGNTELGYFVGAYAGDGSFDKEGSVIFSLEDKFKKKIIEKISEISKKYFGAICVINKNKKTRLVTLKVHSKAAVGLCKDFVEGIKREKCYKAKLFSTSREFRQGVLEGHYDTDGGNRNRIYTSSKKMTETLNMLAATLGTATCIYEDNREGRLGKEPNYAVLFYKLNRKNYGDIWFKKDNRLWVRIKEIKRIKNNTAYCFEVKNDKPIFTIGTTGILTHNCRLRLDQTELRKRGGGLFGANPQTGSIGVVTINMPRLGFTSADEDDFFNKLGELMELAKESLEIKRKNLERFTEKGLYPYSKFYLRNIKERFGEYWKNHFATIGLLGMNECILNFMPGENIGTEKGKEFTIKVLDFMRKKLEEYQLETKNIYNLEATPGEGTAYRFARTDKNRFGRIIVANENSVKDKKSAPYYTNCVSEETECLSLKGWKKYNELKEGDFILTLNTNTKNLEYQPILYKNLQKVNDAAMYNISSRRQDQLITPNHRVLYDGNRKGKYQFSTPENIPYKLIIPMAGKYRPDKTIKVLDEFVELIAWIITEGHFEKDNNGIRITQAEWCNKNNFDDIKKILEKLKLKYTILGDKRGKSIFRISAKDGKILRQKINSKEIPRWCLNNLPSRQQKLLMNTLMKGDGSKSKYSSYYSTGDKKLADQFQELCIKCEKRAIIKNYKDKTRSYHIVPSKYFHTEITKKNIKKTKYRGIVWCPTVENGTWVARRNDKPFITGNSTQLPVNYTTDLFEALELQDSLQTKYTGGTVFHCFVGERLNKTGIKKLVKKISESFNLPYFTITPTFSICPVHGYLSGEHFYCPRCDEEHGIIRDLEGNIIKRQIKAQDVQINKQEIR